MANSRLDELRGHVATALQAFRPAIEAVSSFAWQPADGIYPVFHRAAVRRQYEVLGSVADLALSHSAYAGAPLLRPACEGLLWLRYLNGIDPTHAEVIVTFMTQNEY